MNYLVLDTETTNLEKPFCYNVGYLIANAETGETLLKRSFVVEQVWHNLALFSSAYYADKRPLYVSAMKGKTTKLDKWGYICGQLARDIKAYSVEIGYAYNSPFDEKVFDFNCDWFKTLNPLDTIKMFDIRGYVHNKLAFTDEYKSFCIEHGLLTESGNISTTAESVYRYVFKDLDFIEAHTALADSEIENEILKHCVKLGCIFGQEYKVYKSIPNDTPKTLTVVYNGEEINYNYTKRTNKGNKIYLK